MGSYELVGLFLLHKLAQVIDKSLIGLNRDDGLALLRNTSGTEMEKFRKTVVKIFEELGLKITSELNLHQVDFLDVTLNLNSGKFWPFRKPNNNLLYINAQSNHPKSIITHLPTMIETGISKISSGEKEFEQAKPAYEEALSKSGYRSTLSHSPTDTVIKHRNRSRNIIWFNPPFSKHVKSNIGKEFLKLVQKHFTKNHKLRKVCDKNNIKVSYSCMPNVGSIINNHNQRILELAQASEEEKPCNCRNKQLCPLNGRCNTRCIVYKAEISNKHVTPVLASGGANSSLSALPDDNTNASHLPSTSHLSANQNSACRRFNTSADTYRNSASKKSKDSRIYYGSCEPEFKSRYNNHTYSFRHPHKSSATELSKFYWSSVNRGFNPTVKWSIKKKSTPYQMGRRRCNLCLDEKFIILTAGRDENLLNKRSKIISKCRHKNKFKLKNFNTT